MMMSSSCYFKIISTSKTTKMIHQSMSISTEITNKIKDVIVTSEYYFKNKRICSQQAEFTPYHIFFFCNVLRA